MSVSSVSSSSTAAAPGSGRPMYIPITSPPTPEPSPPQSPSPSPASRSSTTATTRNSSSSPLDLLPQHPPHVTLSHFNSLPASHPLRSTYLNALLPLLTPQELSSLHDTLRNTPLLKRDFIAQLPGEIALIIAGYVGIQDDIHVDGDGKLEREGGGRDVRKGGPRDLIRASQVSKPWRRVMLDESVWKQVAGRDGIARWRWGALGYDHPSFAAEREIISYLRHFKTSHTIAREWGRTQGGKRIGAYNSPDNAIITSLALSSTHIIIALNNPHIHVFSTITGALMRTLTAVPASTRPPHRSSTNQTAQEEVSREGVWAINLVLPTDCKHPVLMGDNTTGGHGNKGSLVVSGGCEKVLRVWDVDNGICLHTLHGHRSTIRCIVTLHRRPISVTGSRDGTLRVWDIHSGRLLRILAGHAAAVRCLAATPYTCSTSRPSYSEGSNEGKGKGPNEADWGLVASGSYDRTIRIWNPATGQCIHTLIGHTQNVYTVSFSPCGAFLASGGLDTTVRVWSMIEGKRVAHLSGHTALVCQLTFTHSRLVSGGADGRIVIFDVKRGWRSELATPRTTAAKDVDVALADVLNISNPSGEDTQMRTNTHSFPILIPKHSHTLAAHTASVSSLIVCDGFPYIVSGGDDGEIVIVRAPSIPPPPCASISGNGREVSEGLVDVDERCDTIPIERSKGKSNWFSAHEHALGSTWGNSECFSTFIPGTPHRRTLTRTHVAPLISDSSSRPSSSQGPSHRSPSTYTTNNTTAAVAASGGSPLSRIWKLAISPDGSRLVVCGTRGGMGWIEIWEFD